MIGLEDPVTGETVCTLSDIELRDASYAETLHYSDVSFENTYAIQPDPDGEGETPYLLTVTLDEDFLQNPNTAYPLTGRYNYAWITNSSDTTVYQYTTYDASASTLDYVGNRESSGYGDCIKMVQLDTSHLLYINPDNISYASYTAQVLGAAEAWYIDLVAPDFTWNPSTVRFSDIDSANDYTLLNSIRMNNTTEKAQGFDVTNEVKKWIRWELQENATSADSAQGLAFKAFNCPDNSYRAFRSNETPSSLDLPVFAINFYEDDSVEEGLYFIRNSACQNYLDANNSGTAEGTGTTIYGFHGANNQIWRVRENTLSAGLYTISPYYDSGLYLTAGNTYGSSLVLSETSQYWRIIQNKDGTFRLFPYESTWLGAEPAGHGTAGGTNVHMWMYTGSSTQKWVFEEATIAGGAMKYYECSSWNVNCFGYALNKEQWIEAPLCMRGENNEYLIESAKEDVLNLIDAQELHYRVLSGPNQYLRPNEWRIVYRAGENKIPSLGFIQRSSHFMKQLDTGGWAEKQGHAPSKNLGMIDISTYSWDWLEMNSDGELVNKCTGFYDSPPIYIAVWQ